MFCRGCHYDLSRATSRTCPECGVSFDPLNPKSFLLANDRLSIALHRIHRMGPFIVLAAIALVASWAFFNLWHTYSGGTWVTSSHNLQYTHLEHDNIGSFIGGVFHPMYSSSGTENRSVSSYRGTITLSGKPIKFHSGLRFAVISQDGTV